MHPTALIADDEEHLRAHLEGKLARLWPELTIVAQAAHGPAALEAIRRLRPDLAFLDIRMPGLSGLEVARQAAGGPTRFVFVTAYDQFALDAFDREAIDYLVKPVGDERLARTIDRLRRVLAEAGKAAAQPDLDLLLDRLAALTGPGAMAGTAAGAAGSTRTTPGVPEAPGAPAAVEARSNPGSTPVPGPLRWIRASLGDTTRHIPVEDVRYFRSDDKYTEVHTTDLATGRDHLIRTPLTELLTQLDVDWFWQIHRSIVVNMRHVAASRRDETGRLFVRLQPDGLELPVSRAYVHRFRQM